MFQALAFVALCASAVSAGKRGLAWPWCMWTFLFYAHIRADATLFHIDNGQLDPGVLNNGQGQVVAM